jgi:hypothetical protein
MLGIVAFGIVVHANYTGAIPRYGDR